MKQILFVILCASILATAPAHAVKHYEIGHGTSLGGFCFWTAFIDTFPDGSYILYYETDCGGNGLAVPKDPRGRPKTKTQMKVETENSPDALKVRRNAAAIAKRVIAKERATLGIKK